MDLALNNLQMLIRHKTQQTKPSFIDINLRHTMALSGKNSKGPINGLNRSEYVLLFQLMRPFYWKLYKLYFGMDNRGSIL